MVGSLVVYGMGLVGVIVMVWVIDSMITVVCVVDEPEMVWYSWYI